MPVARDTYLDQLMSDSVGMRRCLHQAPVPTVPHRGSQAPIHTPYATDTLKHRPASAPIRRSTVYTTTQPHYHKTPQAWRNNPSIPYTNGSSSLVSKPPYAERQHNGFSNYSHITESHNHSSLAYSSLDDPHLEDYFATKFGTLIHSKRQKLGETWGYGNATRSSSVARGNTSAMSGGKKVKCLGEGPVLYKIAVTTGDKKNASTTAKVFIHLRGTKAKINKTRLMKATQSKDTDYRFGKSTTNVFKLRGPELGDIRSIAVETSATKKVEAWFLQEVEVVNTKTKKSWVFVCNQWLSLYHTDGHVMRELYPIKSHKTEYEVVTVTGDIKGAGTDASVYISIFGKTGVTPKILLKNNSRNCFENSSSDMFVVKAISVGPLTKIRIEHDNTGFAPGWFLERVVVTDLKTPRWKYFFPCGEWLARDEADGSICRDLMGSRDPLAIRKANKYKVTVYTGDKRGAGTDANVSIILFGENGESPECKLTTKSKNNFERAKADEFVIDASCLGRLTSVRIGHDNSGMGPGWFLDKIIVDDTEMGTVYEFPCHRWLARDEDDGKISRELLVNVGPQEAPAGVPYTISVSTGDVRNAGTDARVYVILYGGKGGKDNSGTIWLEGGQFERDKTDIFNVEVTKVLSPLSHIDVGHDNTGAGPGWNLDKVVVNCPSAGIEQHFVCEKWLADDEGDELIQRTLYEQKNLRKKREKLVTWYVWVETSDIRGAGTDADVYICLYGDKGKSDDLELDNKTNNFEQGMTDNFKVEVMDVGKPYKLRVWHLNNRPYAGWHLKKITMENMSNKQRYTFPVDRWLAEDEDDGQLVREVAATGGDIKHPLPVEKYEVEVHTGKKTHAGTDANVFINIFGELGDTGDRPLIKSKNNRNMFEKGSVDLFTLEAVTLKNLRKIKIGHDGKHPGAGWFLDQVIVKQVGSDQFDTVFGCQRWFATDEDDGAIIREITASGSQMLSTTSYHISVKTGDIRNAGTDANVFIKIFGETGDSGSLKLRTSENTMNKFERGRIDSFRLEAVDVGKIKKTKLWHDNSSLGGGWFLDEIIIDIASRGERYIFACHRWLAKDEGDGLMEVELEPSSVEDRDKTIPYEVTVWTGDVSGGGTDANVFLQMYGQNGRHTEEVKLRNRTDNFERGQMDKFKIEEIKIGRIQKIRIGHDGKGLMSGWFLDKVLIQCQRTSKKKRPITKKSETLRRQSVIAEISDGYDSDVTDSTYDSRKQRRKTIDVTMKDRRRDSSILGNKRQSDSDERDSPSPRNIRRKRSSLMSETDSLSSSFDKKKRQSVLGTVAEEFENVEEQTDDYWFLFDRWFARSEDDGLIVREATPTDERGTPLKDALLETDYEVRVYTGDVFGAGTDANVFVNLFGENGDSGERQLKESNFRNKFERSQVDTFTIKAIDLGNLVKAKIRHDNAGGGAAWFLDRLEVNDHKHKKSYFFPCQRWLAVNEDDGQITRELVPVDQSLMKKLEGKDSTGVRDQIALETKAVATTFHVKVITGKVWGAGTDANVFVVLYGENDSTGDMYLKSSLTHKNKFESGNTDEFILEAVNIGKLKKIKIGHDNAGGGAAWFLDEVFIDAPSLGQSWHFPCSRWLAKNEDDGLIERELFPQELATEEYTPYDSEGEIEVSGVPYEITTHTSDVSGAGTDADVFVVLYGKDLCTQQKSLCVSKREAKDKFKRGTVNKFVIEMEDVGDTIEKIRVGHDGTGFGSGWHLKQIDVRKLFSTGRNEKSQKGSVTYTFPCNRWLARGEDDGSIVRELVTENFLEETLGRDGEIRKKQMRKRDSLAAKKYTINVHTGDIKGAGTDANVFLTMFGDKGDTGERKLMKSETNRDKFERGQVDRFIVDAVDLGKVFKIHIRHDNSLINPSWFLDKVDITDMSSGDTTVFFCERWLAKNKDDGKIERSFYIKGYDGDMSSQGTLSGKRGGSISSLDTIRSSDPFTKSPRLSLREKSLEQLPEGPTIAYTVKVSTGDEADAGTSSNAWIKIYGPKKQCTGRLFLRLIQKEQFEPSSTETFSLEALELTEIRQIEIGHDGTTAGSGWFIKSIEVDVPTKGRHYFFNCRQWLSRDKGDGRTSRVLCVSDGESSVVSYKPMVPYEVTIHTGDVEHSGTDSLIKMTVFGANGSTGEIVLEKLSERFERGRVDLINLEIDDIAPITKIRIGHNGKSSRPDWFLEKVELRNMDTGDLFVFKCDKWLSRTKGEQKLSYDLAAIVRGKQQVKVTSYKIKVKTSSCRGAGTDANVFVTLFGATGDSGEIPLTESETHSRKFEKDQEDVFVVKEMLSLGELSKCRVWHDNKGLGAAWHLAQIEVEDMGTSKLYTFLCDKWLSKTDDDKQIVRELTCSTQFSPEAPSRDKEKVCYDIEVVTTDCKDGGTIHNGWIILEGTLRETKAFLMENSPHNKVLRRGQTDYFKFTTRNIGKLVCCVIGAVERSDRPLRDASGRDAMWHCGRVSITDSSTGDKFVLPCKDWVPVTESISKRDAKTLAIKTVEGNQVSTVRNLASVKYEVVVITGDVSGAGTNANVTVTIFGENGDTGARKLQQKFRDLFERNQTDKFPLEALDLGKLTKLRIEHDNSGFSPGWFLDRVEVTNTGTNTTTQFLCGQWLDKKRGDGEIVREVYARSD